MQYKFDKYWKIIINLDLDTTFSGKDGQFH